MTNLVEKRSFSLLQPYAARSTVKLEEDKFCSLFHFRLSKAIFQRIKVLNVCVGGKFV